MAHSINFLLCYLPNVPNFEGDSIVHVNDQIKAFQKSGRFLRIFLCYAAKWSDKHDKLNNFMDLIDELVVIATYSIKPFVLNFEDKSIVHEHYEDILELSDVFSKIELTKLEASEFFEVPKWQSSNGMINTIEILASFLDFLLEYTLELLHSEIDLPLCMEDQMQIIREELRFLITFLGDTLLLSAEPEGVESLLEDIEAVANGTGKFFYSFYFCKNEEVVAEDITLALSNLLQKIELINAKIKNYVEALRPQRIRNSMTGEFLVGFAESLQQNLKELIKHKADLIMPVKDHIRTLQEELVLLMSFVMDISKDQEDDMEIKDLVARICSVTKEVEYILDSFVVKVGPNWYFASRLSYVLEEIKVLKADFMVLSNPKDDTGVLEKNFSVVPSQETTPKLEDIVVGFDNETITLKEQLTGGTEKCQVISIVGMAGLGKTTLAEHLYNDALIAYHFHIRAWCFVSQAYQRRDLLLAILRSIIKLNDQIYKMSEEDLANELYKRLKGKRYLIVMDDIWDIQAWNELRRSFPNDRKGSRILVTSWLKNVALQIEPDVSPLELRFLTEDECWDLLREKVFHKGCCPQELVAIGKQIASQCQGLPLVVVVIAGVLSVMDNTENSWEQVAKSLSSHIARDPKSLTNVIEKSYKHLPVHLKACFLYCGACLGDKEIPTQKLLHLWVAQGLVQNTEQKSAEYVAEEYLMELISRSLLLVAERRSDGGVKTCRIHDLLRDLCLRKAYEEDFVKATNRQFSVYEKHRHLCLHSEPYHLSNSRPFGSHVHSLLGSFSHAITNYVYDVSSLCHSLRLLRILDLWGCELGRNFPNEIVLLVHLRYLAIRGAFTSIPSSISSLWNLEVLLVRGRFLTAVEFPDALSNLLKLRHVHVNRIDFSSACYLRAMEDETFQFHSLESISNILVCSSYEEQILRCFSNLRKLKCEFSEVDDWEMSYRYPILNFLSHLESLNVTYRGWRTSDHLCILTFPQTLKKLTMSKFHLPWDKMPTTIGTLPNLEVLKLLDGAFEGPQWDTNEGEFQRLKCLKFDDLNIEIWNASTDHFPRLQRLVLQKCRQLEEIPSCLGDIPTLQIIEVKGCSHSAVKSAMQIQQDQQDMGNEGLKVVIYAPDQENDGEDTDVSADFYDANVDFYDVDDKEDDDGDDDDER